MSNFTIKSGQVGAFILTPDDTLQVMSGGQSLASVVGPDAREYVSSGAESSIDHVLSGGRLLLSRGSVAQGDLIDAGGAAIGPGLMTNGVHNFGLVAGATLRGKPSGEDTLFDFGTERNVHLYNSAASLVQGEARGDHIFSGGVEHVESRGLTVDAKVFAGGSLVLDAHASAQKTALATGAVEKAQSDAVERDARIAKGALLEGTEALRGQIVDAGLVSGGALAMGVFTVASGGVADALRVAKGADLTIRAGGEANDVSVTAQGSVVDDGVLAYTGRPEGVLKGALSGDGVIVQGGPGILVEDADASGFKGTLAIRAGIVELEAASGLGRGDVAFQATVKPATLELRGAGAPSAGSRFSGALTDFDSRLDHVDLHDQAYVAGATATVSGSTLTLHDGAYTAQFTLGGEQAKGYVVSHDAAGGTLIRARGAPSSAIVEAAAGFDADRSPIHGASAPHGSALFTPELAGVASTRTAHA